MATTNDELSTQVDTLSTAVMLQTDEILDQIRGRITGAEVKMTLTGDDILKVLGIVVVGNLAATGLWVGGKFLWEKNQENKKKEG